MRLIEELRIATLLYMVRHGLTQQQMAKRLRVTQPCIRAWCFEDRNVPSADLLERLVSLLRQDGIMAKAVTVNLLGEARAAVGNAEIRDTAAKKRLAEIVGQHTIKTKPVNGKGK